MNETKNSTAEENANEKPDGESPEEPKRKRTFWEKVKGVAKDFWHAINHNDSSPIT